MSITKMHISNKPNNKGYRTQDVMQLTVSKMPPKSASSLLFDTITSRTAFPFLSLPAEIRLLIYSELLVQSDGLPRTFCRCWLCAHFGNRMYGKDCLTVSLLRTSKAIYHESLPILYSKSLFSFLCSKSYRHLASLDVSRHHWSGIFALGGGDGLNAGPLANRHPPWAGLTGVITTCPSDSAKPCVRRIWVRLLWRHHTVLDGFPTQWWQPVESDVLRLFPGSEQVTVHISLKEMPVSNIYVVFRRRDLMAERRQNYKSILADTASLLHPSAKAREDLRMMEAICDALVHSHTQGEMKNCILGVKTVGWTENHWLGTKPYVMHNVNTNIHLGCH